MIRHLALPSLMSLLVVACMMYPFFPGEYDPLAATVSGLAQLVGFAGAVLIPLGAVWLAYELRSPTTDAGLRWGTTARYRLALASLAASALVGAVLSLAAFLTVGPSLGFAAIALCLWYALRLLARAKAMRREQVHAFNGAPLYLIFVPAVVIIARLALLGPVSDLSRDRTIDNSATLIADIERYRDERGHYPPSLLAVWKDYKPGSIGVEKYQYEPNGNAYNVYFEHFVDRFGTREFVMYNTRDEHRMASHTTDRLEWTTEQLAVRRGWYAVHEASRPHWKRFWFD